MLTLGQLRRIAGYHGATVDGSAWDNGILTVDAPDGYAWRCNGATCIAVDTRENWNALACAAEDMSEGLDPCTEGQE